MPVRVDICANLHLIAYRSFDGKSSGIDLRLHVISSRSGHYQSGAIAGDFRLLKKINRFGFIIVFR